MLSGKFTCTLGEENNSNKGSTTSLRAQDSTMSKSPSVSDRIESEQETAESAGDKSDSAETTNQLVDDAVESTSPPPFSPTSPSKVSDAHSSLVNQSQEPPTWREVTVSGGE